MVNFSEAPESYFLVSSPVLNGHYNKMYHTSETERPYEAFRGPLLLFFWYKWRQKQVKSKKVSDRYLPLSPQIPYIM